MPSRTLAALAAGAMLPAAGMIRQQTSTAAAYSRAVSAICADAALFTGRHEIGTRAGAIAVARDIRATGRSRLNRVSAVPKPSGSVRIARRWIVIERRLVETYASTYVSIWLAIERAYALHARAGLPATLRALVHRPDALRHRAARLEHRLRVPDCTGGRPRTS